MSVLESSVRAATVSVSDVLADMERPALADFARLLLRRYPPVTYGIDDAEYIPVFVFHTLREDDFARKLQFLQSNGYRTVSLDESVAWMAGVGKLPPRAVVLTIDDGRASTWSVAAPLLKKFSMQATAYVVPGYLEEGPIRPTLEDVWSGAVQRNAVERNERDDAGEFMRWSEVETLNANGPIAIGSHTMLHRRVFCGPKLTGFLEPGVSGPLFNIPKYPDDRAAWTRAALAAAAGSPLFEHRPLLGLKQAWGGGGRARDACLDRVRQDGAPEFFARSDWSKILRKIVRESASSAPQWVDLEREKRWELDESRRVLEARLAGRPVRHFCYPNSLGGVDTVTFAQQAGYASSTWGLLDHRLTNRRGANPHLLSRIKHDFILTMRGDGRRSLLEILRTKLERRLGGNTGY